MSPPPGKPGAGGGGGVIEFSRDEATKSISDRLSKQKRDSMRAAVEKAAVVVEKAEIRKSRQSLAALDSAAGFDEDADEAAAAAIGGGGAGKGSGGDAVEGGIEWKDKREAAERASAALVAKEKEAAEREKEREAIVPDKVVYPRRPALDRTSALQAGAQLMVALRAPKVDEEEVVRIINGGAEVNVKDRRTDTPLLLSSAKGLLDITMRLLEYGAAVNVVDVEQNTPLIHCCKAGMETAALRMIDAGAECDAVNEDGLTPLTAGGSKMPLVAAAIKLKLKGKKKPGGGCVVS